MLDFRKERRFMIKGENLLAPGKFAQKVNSPLLSRLVACADIPGLSPINTDLELPSNGSPLIRGHPHVLINVPFRSRLKTLGLVNNSFHEYKYM